MASKWLKFKGMHNGQNIGHATHALKATKRQLRQAYEHAKGTEITCWMVPNHQNDASNTSYTFTYLRRISPASHKCKGAILSMPKSIQKTMDRPKAWQNKHKNFTNLSLKHAKTKAHNLRHVKGSRRHYMATILNMHGVPKPT